MISVPGNSGHRLCKPLKSRARPPCLDDRVHVRREPSQRLDEQRKGEALAQNAAVHAVGEVARDARGPGVAPLRAVRGALEQGLGFGDQLLLGKRLRIVPVTFYN